MQVRAIIEAAIEVRRRGKKVSPEIMIPLTIDARELKILEEQARAVADSIIKAAGVKLDYMVGTMIETPRAALTADEIALVAEFFSFGTNDLTQTTMALSRDDAGRFLPEYCNAAKTGIFEEDPFQSLDQEGVGMLVFLGIDQGRAINPKLKVGICGEHGGDPESVKFCHNVDMDYVSCSPYRVPIARLAAAQAVIEEEAMIAEEEAAMRAAKPKRAAKKSSKKSAGKKATKKAAKKKAAKKSTKKAAEKATKKTTKKKAVAKKTAKKTTKKKAAKKAAKKATAKKAKKAKKASKKKARR